MKRNIFLRAALCLFIGLWASGTALTDTWAKYVATGMGTASARIAKFSVRVGGQKYDSANKNWKAASDASYWDEIVTLDGINPSKVQSFELPLFDYEYATTTRGTTTTVSSVVNSDGSRDLVIAPGTSLLGSSQNNPNTEGYNTAGSEGSIIVVSNDSEVTIRFKIEFDAAASTVPEVDGKRLPLFIYPAGIIGPYNTTDSMQWRVDLVPKTGAKAFRNIFCDPNGVRMMGPAYTPFISTDGWFTLAPGQRTGTSPVPRILLYCGWYFAYDAEPRPGYGTHYSYSGGADAACLPHWDGYWDPAFLPYLTNTRPNNIDRYDTYMGLAAASNPASMAVELKFRITIEQVD